MSKTAARRCRYKPATGRKIFADLDRFLGWHAVLSYSVGRHKYFFSLQIQQTLSMCNKKKVSVYLSLRVINVCSRAFKSIGVF